MKMKSFLRGLPVRAAALVSVVLAAACSDLPTESDVSLDGVRGIDVSHWQGSVDWRAVESDGIAFAFVKATEGATFTDPAFAAKWSGVGGTSIVRGAYHYFRPGADAAQQAAHFLRTVRLSAWDLPPVLDVETTDGVDRATLERGVRTWLDAVSRATGKVPVIYTSRSFWQANLAGASFGEHALWVAHYGAVEPAIPFGWPRWTFWQHSESGRVAGISGPVDLNHFNGTRTGLSAFVSSQGKPAFLLAAR